MSNKVIEFLEPGTPDESRREQHPHQPPLFIVIGMGVLLMRNAPRRLTWCMLGCGWRHLLNPLVLQLEQGFQFIEIEKNSATIIALLDVNVIAVVGAHRASTLRTWHGHTHDFFSSKLIRRQASTK